MEIKIHKKFQVYYSIDLTDIVSHILFTKSCVNGFFKLLLFQTPLLIISFVSFCRDQAQRVKFSDASSLSDAHRGILVMLVIAFLAIFIE